MTGEHVSKCVHHWVIGANPEHTSLGKCRKCGAEKEFPSNPEQSSWKYGRAAASNSYDPVPSPVRGAGQPEDETPSDSTVVHGPQEDDVTPSTDLDEMEEEDGTDVGNQR